MDKNWLTSIVPAQHAPCEKPGAHARATRGETLTETLVGLLIAGLSILMLSSAIATASRLVIQTRKMAETYESSTRALAPGTDTDSDDSTVEITSDGNYGESYNGSSVSVTYTDGDLPGSIKGVTYNQQSTPAT